MPQKGHQASREQPYRRVTGRTESYDEKARIGAVMNGDGDYMPSEDFNFGPIPGPNQDNNGGFQRSTLPRAPQPNISRPKSGGIGGPLE